MISIHALLAESDQAADISARRGARISIHALLAESDVKLLLLLMRALLFLSTLSLRRATVHYDNYNLHCTISIHALLAESDQHQRKQKGGTQQFLSTLSLRRATAGFAFSRLLTMHFYPRSPCGERPFVNCNSNFTQKFLSTLSLRRATGLDGRFKL